MQNEKNCILYTSQSIFNMKFNKGKLLVITTKKLLEINNIHKKILFYLGLLAAFILLTSILLSSILVHYRKKKIENEISVLKRQKEIIYLQYNNLKEEVSNIIIEKKEKNNLSNIAKKLNPNIDQEFLNLWLETIYENQNSIEESLNIWSKIKLSQTKSSFSLKSGSAIALAVTAIESNFHSGAKSKKGAIGAFQIINNTAYELGLKDPSNPVENTLGGIKYLTYLFNTFKDYKDQIHLALAAYNAGPSRVMNEWMPTWGDSWSSIYKGLSLSEKSYRETREYSVLTYHLIKLFSSGNWINKNDHFWINYRNEILAKCGENSSLLFSKLLFFKKSKFGKSNKSKLYTV